VRWYEHVTEAAWFKRLDDPKTRVGHIVTTIVALAFAVIAFAQNPSLKKDCAANPLRGIYNPARLRVLGTCQWIDGTVVAFGRERDGDLHIRFQTDVKWLAAGNARQGGDLVVEYLPGDPWDTPHVGDRLRLTCTWVKDLQHGGPVNGWNECHPVWGVQPLGATAQRIVP
jgi:hypothetical protein